MDISIYSNGLSSRNASISSLVNNVLYNKQKSANSLGSASSLGSGGEGSAYANQINSSYVEYLESLQKTIDDLNKSSSSVMNKLGTLSTVKSSYSRTVSSLDDFINSVKNSSASSVLDIFNTNSSAVNGELISSNVNSQRIEYTVKQVATATQAISSQLKGVNIDAETKIVDLFAGSFDGKRLTSTRTDLTGSMTMSRLGVTTGTFELGGNLISVKGSDTIDDVIEKLRVNGYKAGFDAYNHFYIEAESGNSMKITNQNTNFGDIMGLTMSEGSFSINGQELYINKDTTLNSLLSTINSDSKYGVGAMLKDNKITFIANRTGNVLIEIKKGTSNFTNAIGFTEGGSMNTGSLVIGNDGTAQKLSGNTAINADSTGYTTGTFKITTTYNGTEQSAIITIDEDDSINDIINKVNNSGIDVSATIENGVFELVQNNKGSGYTITVEAGTSDFTEFVGMTEGTQSTGILSPGLDGDYFTHTTGTKEITDITTAGAVTAGSFKINGKTIQLKGGSIEEALAEINQYSEELNIVAEYKDNHITIRNRLTGATSLYIEGGTSNFGEITGLTTESVASSNFTAGAEGSASTLTGTEVISTATEVGVSTIKINGITVNIAEGTIESALKNINAVSDKTYVEASIDDTGRLVLTETRHGSLPISVQDVNGNFGQITGIIGYQVVAGEEEKYGSTKTTLTTANSVSYGTQIMNSTVVVNGLTIGVGTNISEALNAINAHSSATGVEAFLNDEGRLVLRNIEAGTGNISFQITAGDLGRVVGAGTYTTIDGSNSHVEIQYASVTGGVTGLDDYSQVLKGSTLTIGGITMDMGETIKDCIDIINARKDETKVEAKLTSTGQFQLVAIDDSIENITYTIGGEGDFGRATGLGTYEIQGNAPNGTEPPAPNAVKMQGAADNLTGNIQVINGTIKIADGAEIDATGKTIDEIIDEINNLGLSGVSASLEDGKFTIVSMGTDVPKVTVTGDLARVTGMASYSTGGATVTNTPGAPGGADITVVHLQGQNASMTEDTEIVNGSITVNGNKIDTAGKTIGEIIDEINDLGLTGITASIKDGKFTISGADTVPSVEASGDFARVTGMAEHIVGTGSSSNVVDENTETYTVIKGSTILLTEDIISVGGTIKVGDGAEIDTTGKTLGQIVDEINAQNIPNLTASLTDGQFTIKVKGANAPTVTATGDFARVTGLASYVIDAGTSSTTPSVVYTQMQGATTTLDGSEVLLNGTVKVGDGLEINTKGLTMQEVVDAINDQGLDGITASIKDGAFTIISENGMVDVTASGDFARVSGLAGWGTTGSSTSSTSAQEKPPTYMTITTMQGQNDSLTGTEKFVGGSIQIDGNAVIDTDGKTLNQVISEINTQGISGVTASIKDGRFTVTSERGEVAVIASGDFARVTGLASYTISGGSSADVERPIITVHTYEGEAQNLTGTEMLVSGSVTIGDKTVNAAGKTLAEVVEELNALDIEGVQTAIVNGKFTVTSTNGELQIDAEGDVSRVLGIGDYVVSGGSSYVIMKGQEDSLTGSEKIVGGILQIGIDNINVAGRTLQEIVNDINSRAEYTNFTAAITDGRFTLTFEGEAVEVIATGDIARVTGFATYNPEDATIESTPGVLITTVQGSTSSLTGDVTVLNGTLQIQGGTAIDTKGKTLQQIVDEVNAQNITGITASITDGRFTVKGEGVTPTIIATGDFARVSGLGDYRVEGGTSAAGDSGLNKDNFINSIDRLTESEAIAQGYTVIKTAEDLDNIRNNLSGKYILMADIDLSSYSNWTAIGDSTNGFTGELNGNGYAIKNLTINATTDNQGLFGYIDSTDAVVKNLALVDVNVTNTQSNTGALAGSINAAKEITNIYVSGTVNGNYMTGGIAGRLYNSSVSNIKAEITITKGGGAENAGGIAGHMSNAQLTKAIVSGTIEDGSGGNVGGLVGEIQSDVVISNSSFTGDIIRTSTYINPYYYGGLVGTSQGKIQSSYFSGNISVYGSYIGGIAGYTDSWSATIENCYATGSIGEKANKYVGGLIGENHGIVKNSYADMQGIGDSHAAQYGGGVGGIFHVTYSDVINCFYNKDYDTDFSMGIGGCSGDINYDYPYHNTNRGLTTEEMGDKQNFIDAGWDESIWDFSGGMPKLQWEKDISGSTSGSTGGGSGSTTGAGTTITGSVNTDDMADVAFWGQKDGVLTIHVDDGTADGFDIEIQIDADDTRSDIINKINKLGKDEVWFGDSGHTSAGSTPNPPEGDGFVTQNGTGVFAKIDENGRIKLYSDKQISFEITSDTSGFADFYGLDSDGADYDGEQLTSYDKTQGSSTLIGSVNVNEVTGEAFWHQYSGNITFSDGTKVSINSTDDLDTVLQKINAAGITAEIDENGFIKISDDSENIRITSDNTHFSEFYGLTVKTPIIVSQGSADNLTGNEQIISGKITLSYGKSERVVNTSGKTVDQIIEEINAMNIPGVIASIEDGRFTITSTNNNKINITGTGDAARVLGVANYTVEAAATNHLTEAEARARGYTIIKSAEDLKNMGYSGRYILMCDIDMSGVTDWEARLYFSGIFDGNGYTIKNFTSTNGGLFKRLEGEVRNLTMENVNVSAQTGAVGAIANEGGSYGQLGKIYNTFVSGTVSGEDEGSFIGVGGLVGGARSFTNGTGGTKNINIINCGADVTINAKGYAGGLIGLGGGAIVNSYANVNIQAEGNAGGIIGYAWADGDLLLENVFSTGTINNNNNNNYVSNGVGGIIGSTISTNTDLTLINSYSTVALSSNYGTIGGLIGYTGYDKNHIENSYYSGVITGSASADGLVGDSLSSEYDTIKNNFWNIELSGVSTSECGGTGLTNAQMADMQTFIDAGWDESVWDFSGSTPTFNQEAQKSSILYGSKIVDNSSLAFYGQKDGTLTFSNGVSIDISETDSLSAVREKMEEAGLYTSTSGGFTIIGSGTDNLTVISDTSGFAKYWGLTSEWSTPGIVTDEYYAPEEKSIKIEGSVSSLTGDEKIVGGFIRIGLNLDIETGSKTLNEIVDQINALGIDGLQAYIKDGVFTVLTNAGTNVSVYGEFARVTGMGEYIVKETGKVGKLSESEAISQGYTIIKTASDLASISNTKNKKYILMNDIDLSSYGNWSGINLTNAVFEGNGYMIKNLTGSSLFNTVTESQIYNLGLENVNVTGTSNIGALAKTMKDTDVDTLYISGSVTATQYGAAGVVGTTANSNNDTTTLHNLYIDVDVNSLGQGVAAGSEEGSAAIAYDFDGDISYSYFGGTVSSYNGATAFIGKNTSTGSYANANIYNSVYSSAVSGFDKATLFECSGYRGLEDLSLDELQNPSNYANFDETVWDIEHGLPTLRIFNSSVLYGSINAGELSGEAFYGQKTGVLEFSDGTKINIEATDSLQTVMDKMEAAGLETKILGDYLDNGSKKYDQSLLISSKNTDSLYVVSDTTGFADFYGLTDGKIYTTGPNISLTDTPDDLYTPSVSEKTHIQTTYLTGAVSVSGVADKAFFGQKDGVLTFSNGKTVNISASDSRSDVIEKIRQAGFMVNYNADNEIELSSTTEPIISVVSDTSGFAEFYGLTDTGKQYGGTLSSSVNTTNMVTMQGTADSLTGSEKFVGGTIEIGDSVINTAGKTLNQVIDEINALNIEGVTVSIKDGRFTVESTSGIVNVQATGDAARITGISSYITENVTAPNKNFINTVEAISEEEAIAQGYTVIKTAEDLLKINDDLSGKYILMNDIDMVSVTDFVPIGGSNGFAGIFDGNGFVIKNLTINDTSSEYVGLFGMNQGTIKNVGVENVNVTGNGAVGGLVGINGGTGVVSNSYVSGSVTSLSDSSNVLYGAGGLVGANFLGGTITDSKSSGTVIGKGYTGGLVGGNFVATLKNSYSTSSVSGVIAGGLVGYFAGASGVDDVNGAISNSYATGAVNGTVNAGGLIGQTYVSGGEANIVNSYATGTVTGNGNIGGLVGDAGNGTYFKNTFWNSNSTGQENAVGYDLSASGGKTDISDFSDLSVFINAGWDESIWDFSGSAPTLKDQNADAAAKDVVTIIGSTDTSTLTGDAFHGQTSGSLTFSDGTTVSISASDNLDAVLAKLNAAKAAESPSQKKVQKIFP